VLCKISYEAQWEKMKNGRQNKETVFHFCHGLAPVSNKEQRSCSLTPPHPWWGGEKNQKEKARLVGWDKNSLNEQQREKKRTTVILIKRIYRV